MFALIGHALLISFFSRSDQILSLAMIVHVCVKYVSSLTVERKCPSLLCKVNSHQLNLYQVVLLAADRFLLYILKRQLKLIQHGHEEQKQNQSKHQAL